MSEKPTLKQILPQLQSWCAVNNVSVQSVYDECHGMTLQEIVYYLFGVVKKASEEVVDYEGQFEELYNYVHDYFNNLDVQEEINNKLDEMSKSGELLNLMKPFISETTDEWLSQNIANPSNPPLDASFTLENAAAQSKAIGDNGYIFRGVLTGNVTLSQNRLLGSYGIDNSAVISDKPSWYNNGTVLTLTNEQGEDGAYIMQRLYSSDTMLNMSYRLITTEGDVYVDWQRYETTNYFMYREKIRTGNVKLSNYRENGIYLFEGATIEDLPPQVTKTSVITLYNSISFNDGFVTQYAYISNNTNNPLIRVIYKSNGNTYIDWNSNSDALIFYTACGDSFTAGGYSKSDGIPETEYEYQYAPFKGNQITYPFEIALRNGWYCRNLAVAGMTLAHHDGSNAFVDGTYLNIPDDTKFLTIKFGINDNNVGVPIGEIDSTDISTFYGAWNTVLTWIFENRPLAHVGIIVSNGISNTDYTNATINICKKYGIPYLDEVNGNCTLLLRANRDGVSEERLNQVLEQQRISETNLHPNVNAHKLESYMVEQFIKSL